VKWVQSSETSSGGLNGTASRDYRGNFDGPGANVPAKLERSANCKCFALADQKVSITSMKVVILLLALSAVMCIAGCTSYNPPPEPGASHSSFGGPPAMPGSDSSASENRY
jgi:hypothetical protein